MKTGAWLRGGRGKIAGMVAQKSSDGKGTVLRELVVPKNPQTVDQMATRLAFGTVTQAAALMLPIIGQTFKGMTDEKLNRRRFVALNVPEMKAQALIQRNGGDINALFRGKNSTMLIPNSYIISEGKLNAPEILKMGVEDGAFTGGDLAGQEFTLTVDNSYTGAQILAELFNVNIQSQITIVGIGTVDGEPGYYPNGSDDFIRESTFLARRIVFNPDAPSHVYTANTTSEEVTTWVLEGIDTEKSSASVLDLITNGILFNANKVSIDCVLYHGFDVTGTILRAVGIIVSRLDNGQWDYNTCKMAFLPNKGDAVAVNNDYSGLSFNNALVDYIGAEAASKLYTRKGGLINDI